MPGLKFELPDLACRPEAAIFPLIGEVELAELVADIRARGLLSPIVLHHDGTILDGRNRYAAMRAIGQEPRYQTWRGPGTELEYVISQNLRRRHLNESQRAMVASRIANMRRGGDRRSDQAANLPVGSVSQSKAAALMNVSERSVRDGSAVIERGDPKIVSLADRGKVSVAAAAEVARMAPEAQAGQI